ncbi:hypothetical protein BJL95_18380 [Methylomonas sp. LWB]|nr:hypothetical protein BJL95_18380 [Methylomonas sp. LWB]
MAWCRWDLKFHDANLICHEFYRLAVQIDHLLFPFGKRMQVRNNGGKQKYQHCQDKVMPLDGYTHRPGT